MDNDKVWENSLRSSLYIRKQPPKARPTATQIASNRRVQSSDKSLSVKCDGPQPSQSEHPSRRSPTNIWSIRRTPRNTQSSPTLHTYTKLQHTVRDQTHPDDQTFSISPTMNQSTGSSSDSSPKTEDLSFNRSYLSMIKKRQALLYGLSQHEGLDSPGHQNANVQSVDSSNSMDIQDVPMARFSRHIANDIRQPSTMSTNERRVLGDLNPERSTKSLSKIRENFLRQRESQWRDVGGSPSTIVKVEDVGHEPVATRSIEMKIKKVSSTWEEPSYRAEISEPVSHVIDKATIAEYQQKFHVTSTSGRRMSYARSYTRNLHHGVAVDNWDTWDRGLTRKLSQIHDDESDEDLQDLLPAAPGLKKKSKVKNVRAQMNCCSLLWHDFKAWRMRRKYQKENNPIFQKQINIVESQFGSGTVSYFIFVRWLLLLNALLCVMWLVTVVLPQAVFYTGYVDMLDNFYFTNLMDGKNALTNSFMFYGGYDASLGKYPLALVYLCCILFTYFGSLFIVFKGIASSLHTGGQLQDTRHMFFNLVLSGWDFSLNEGEAVRNMASGLANTFRDLISETRSKAARDRTGKEKVKLIVKRIIAWTLTVVLIGFGCAAIFFMISTDVVELVTNLGYTVDDSNAVVVYAPSFLFMTINFLIATCISNLPRMEDYVSGKEELITTTVRVFVLRMVNILALVGSLYFKQQHQTGCVGTYLGQELYKLVILDTIIQLLRSLIPSSIKYFWTLKKTEFKIPPRVLILVYRQALIWLGSLVCPVMPLVGVISTAILFTENYIILTVMCKPPTKRWNQSRRNTLFLGLTAATLMILIAPISIVITRNDSIQLWVQTNQAVENITSLTSVCGPFGNDTLLSAFWVTHDLLEDVEPVSATMVQLITSGTVLLPLIFIIIAVVYFQRLRVSWQKSKMRSMFLELVTEREHNRDLMRVAKILTEVPKT